MIELGLTEINQSNMKNLLECINDYYIESLNLTRMGKISFHCFSEYLEQVRIENSIELLQKEEVSIAEISKLVGYIKTNKVGNIHRISLTILYQQS